MEWDAAGFVGSDYRAVPRVRENPDARLASVLRAIAGYDPACSVSFPVALAPPHEAGTTLKVGYAMGLGDLAVSDSVVAVYNRGIAALRATGAQLVPVDLRRWELARVRRTTLASCESAMWRVHRRRVLEQPEDFSDDLRAFIRYCGKLTDEDLAAAERRIADFALESKATAEPFDAVVMATVACASFPHGERHPYHIADLTAIAIAIAIATAAGAPAASLALTAGAESLPIGLQVVCRPGTDLRVCQLAAAIELELQRAH